MVVLTEPQGDGVVLVTLNRPDALNALNDTLRTALAEQFTAFAADPGVRCVVLTGSDKAFAAGADIAAMATAGTAEVMLRARETMWQPIKDFPKPLIAAVNGWALGGGCELAMHADIIIAGESARFGQPEIKVGTIPGAGGTQRLVRAVGKFKAMKLLLTGAPVTAQEAEAMGLISKVVPDDQTRAHALAMAKKIAALPPLGARKIKEVVLAGADLPLEAALLVERQAFQLLFDTMDQKEGMAAFLEKRKPSFRGK
ncbi:enoyl-CoA hydratase-related protein [Actibacterium sp. D379-3]